MMNNINKRIPYQVHQQQRNRYRSNERVNFSPNNHNVNNINNINTLKNQNYNNKIHNIQKNNNIYYINPRNNQNQNHNHNQVNSSQNLAALKYLKSKQQNQIYLEGDLNSFINNQNNNKYSSSKINKQNNNINNINNNLDKQKKNLIGRILNEEKTKNNRGLPRKSPIPIPKGFITGKYINSDNMSYMSKNSNNSNHSNYTVNSQLINNNYSISNLSQISGYSNNSYNNNMINFGSIIDNDHIRAHSNNIHSSMTQKRFNRNNNHIHNYNKQNNKNMIQNKSANNILNKQNKIRINNYINNNNNINNLINAAGNKNAKNNSKSPNQRGKDYLSYTIKRNMSNNNKQTNNNYFNNSNISNASNTSNESLINKIGYRTSSNFSSSDNNINSYDNYNYINQNDIHIYLNKNGRPLTSKIHMNNTMKRSNLNKKIKYNNAMTPNKFGLNPNDINLNSNYNSNEAMHRQNMLLINKNKMNNNYIHQYNSHNPKRHYSANISNNRNNNFDKNNNEYVNNLNHLNNINPMVNLHIINKGQIINNNYNNVNSNMNNMNNLYVYKYDISQNNILHGNYNTNSKDYSSNKTKSKNAIRNNNNINKMNVLTKDDININFNNINNLESRNGLNNERQNIHKYMNKKGIKIRSNSSSGLGVTGELNNIINKRNNDKANHNLINAKKIDPSKLSLNNNNYKNNLNNNKPINMTNINKVLSPTKNPVVKHIRKIHHFTHVGFNGERDKDFNQDIAFLEKNFAGNNSYLYLAVCDGHGLEGHEVSGFIKRVLPKELSKSLYQKDILTNDKNDKKKIYNIIGQTFIKVNEQLISNETINSIFSGTTCVSVIYTPIKLICANIGDSRAVLGRYDQNLKKWVSINLSRDHKPTEEDEARRIFKKGGRIKPFVDEETGEEVGPQRVWVKDDEVPGLAMTRSFGDRVASIAGTICVPEIKEYFFNEGDKFLILASDGVWEFIQSEECINIIGKFYLNNNIEGCCEFLYNESRKRWIKEEEVVDDITMLLAFFD